jgi:hypothetical protein
MIGHHVDDRLHVVGDTDPPRDPGAAAHCLLRHFIL